MPGARAGRDLGQAIGRRPFDNRLGAGGICVRGELRDEVQRHASADSGRATAGAYLDPVRERVKPLSEGLFAGAYEPNKVGFAERAILKMIKAPPGDFRKWDEVETWATGLVPLFAARPA